MLLFYSIHYPRPEKEALLVQSMHKYGELMKKQPGLIFVAPYPFKDTDKGTLTGVSIWESEEAFQVAIPLVRGARKEEPDHDEWEIRPPEVYTLNSVVS